MKHLLSPSRPVKTSRDIVLLKISRARLLAVSCDAAGAVGSKRLDKVRTDPRLVGKMTARVALMELLSIGANPIAIIGTFSVEPEPTGNQVIEGIEEELRSSQLRDLKLLCSSEKNMKVDQTGIGITVVGVVSSSAVKIAQCEEGDEVIAVGEPYVGREVIHAEKHRMLPNTLDVMKLRRNRFVHELIPVGSKGILYEARLMAEDSRLFFEPLSSQQVDLKKSAGPATVLVSAIRKGSFAQVKKALGAKPIGKIGTLRQR